MSSTAESVEKIRIQCDACGGRFKVPAKLAGRAGKCPKCKATIVVPELAPSPADEGEMDWGALAGAEASAAPSADDPVLAAAAAGPVEGAAPARFRISEQMAGLTPQQRRALADRAERRARNGGKDEDESEEKVWGFPSFLAGLGLCLAGCVLGGLMWYGLLAATGKEWRLLAIGIGVLAGGGMYAGLQKNDMSAGTLAAMFAGLTILAAKFAMATWGQSYIVANDVEEYLDEESVAVEEEYDASRIELVSLDDAREGALEFETDKYLRETGMGWEFYTLMDWQQQKHIKPIRERVNAMDADEARHLYRMNAVTDDVTERHADEAEDAVRAELGLPSTAEVAAAEPDCTEHDEADCDRLHEEWYAFGALSDDEAEAEARWEQVNAAREASEEAAWAELIAMTPEQSQTAYDAQREASREEQLAWLAQEREIELGYDPTAEQAAENRKWFLFRVFGIKDLFIIPLAIGTAFGIGTGLRGD